MTMDFSNLVPDDLTVLVSTVDAASAVGTHPQTIRQWKSRKLLAPAGLDKYGRPLYRLLDVLQTEQRTRKSMIDRANRSRMLSTQ